MFSSKKVFCTLSTLLVLTASASFAENIDLGRNLSAHVGAYCPTDGNIKDAVGAAWLDLGLSYKISGTPISEHSLGIGWIQGTKSYNGYDYDGFWSADTSVRMVPITYTYKTKPKTNPKVYFGGGAGMYLTRISASYSSYDGDMNAGESQTRYAVHLVAGTTLSENISADVRYTQFLDNDTENEYDPKPNLSGLSLNIGARF